MNIGGAVTNRARNTTGASSIKIEGKADRTAKVNKFICPSFVGLDYQPLFEKWARVPSPGEDRKNGRNRA